MLGLVEILDIDAGEWRILVKWELEWRLIWPEVKWQRT
jgi:hypothetical protein